MSFLGRLRRFIHEQSKNYNVLLVRGTVSSFLMRLVQNFNNLYIVELGATPLQLGMVRAVGSAASAAISIPAGWLSDLYSLKKIMAVGLIIQVLSVAFYAFARDWIWIIVAMVFAMLTMTLVYRTESVFIANSLTDYNRAVGYGMRTTIIQSFGVFAPTIGGILVYFFGGISVEGIRPLYFIRLLGLISVSIYVILKLTDITIRSKSTARDFFGDYKEMFRARSNLKRFAFIQSLGSITYGMSMPFIFVYVADFKGAGPLIIGYMGTCQVIVSMLLAIPMGSLGDSRGRKFVIYLARPFFWGSYILLIFTPKNVSWLLLLAWSLRGVEMAHMSFTTMSMEMVPQEYRGRWVGFNSLFQNLIRVPASILGGYLYEEVNPVFVFIIPVLVDALVRLPILFTIPDTLKKKSATT
jgi:MFS family permease